MKGINHVVEPVPNGFFYQFFIVNFAVVEMAAGVQKFTTLLSALFVRSL